MVIDAFLQRPGRCIPGRGLSNRGLPNSGIIVAFAKPDSYGIALIEYQYREYI